MSKLESLIGRKFGKLTVSGFHGRVKKRTYWECICDCGSKCLAMSSKLKDGLKTHCGCVKRVPHNKSHGRSRTPMHNVWWGMIERCESPYNKNYSNYGGRGIRVCDRWLGKEGFINFLKDMGERPSDKYSIERIDNNGNYEPSNCKWDVLEVQANNKRTSRFISFNGKTQTLAQWSKEKKFPPALLTKRLKRGWTIEKALNTPSYFKVENGKSIVWNKGLKGVLKANSGSFGHGRFKLKKSNFISHSFGHIV